MAAKTRESKKDKQASGAICPRCGAELHKTSDISVSDHSVNCWKCGYTLASNISSGTYIIDMDMEMARIM